MSLSKFICSTSATVQAKRERRPDVRLAGLRLHLRPAPAISNKELPSP